MSISRDRRSSKSDAEPAPSRQEQVERDAGIQRRQDGTIRRITPGIRSLRDFLDPEQADRTMTRGDVVNTLSALYYYDRESRWYRRIWRFFQHMPQVKSVSAEMANAHARGLEVAKQQMEEQVEHANKSAQAFRAGSKAESEGK
jgi:hypothetical protein